MNCLRLELYRGITEVEVNITWQCSVFTLYNGTTQLTLFIRLVLCKTFCKTICVDSRTRAIFFL